MQHSICLVTNGTEDQAAYIAAKEALKNEKSVRLVPHITSSETIPNGCLLMPVSYEALNTLCSQVSPTRIIRTAPTAYAPVPHCTHCSGRTDTTFIYYKDQNGVLTYLDFMTSTISTENAAMPHTAAKVTVAFDPATSGRYTVIGGKACPAPHPLTPLEATRLRQLGVNLWLLPIFEHLGHNVSIPIQSQPGRFTERGLEIMLDHIYLDLDDTLIIHGELNPNCLKLLTIAKEAKCPVTLITRHYQEPSITLAEIGLSAKLFDHICWITDGKPKSYHMDASIRSIFIDDAYNERVEVIAKKGILSYPPDIMEILVPVLK